MGFKTVAIARGRDREPLAKKLGAQHYIDSDEQDGAAAEPLEVPPLLLILGRRSIVGWPSGTSIDSRDTLSFSALTGVRSMNEVFPLNRVTDAYERMTGGKAQFRAVLTTGR